jgi:hypothetical protein
MTTNSIGITEDQLLALWNEDNNGIIETLSSVYKAGADAQLEKCCEWLSGCGCESYGRELRAAMRPKTPSLKQQLKEQLATGTADGSISPRAAALMRVTIESLPNQ